MTNTNHAGPTAGKRLRQLLSAGPIRVPGAFNPLIAIQAERIGFPAVYLSGAALSACKGLPDVGLVTLSEFVAAAGEIAQATSLPLICDADTGFGEALNVERAVRLFESAGVAGIHLEDQELPKRCGHLSGKSLVSAEEMVAKIRAAVAARRDPDFVIIARTDARGVTGFDDAVRRARMYMDAGADCIFPEAMESEAEFSRFAHEVPGWLLANVTEFGKSPLLTADVLERAGYRMILFPVTTLRMALKATEAVLREIANQGTQKQSIASMLTRAELYELLNYTSYEHRDQAYFSGGTQ